MLEKSQNAVFFHRFVRRVSRKVGLLKRRVRRHVVRAEIKNCTLLWRKAHFEVKVYKTPHGRSTFGSSDVEKLHAAVARSTFRSQNVKKLRVWEHFLKFWCRKIERRSGETHIWKWTCLKTVLLPLFEILTSQNCTRLWREARSEVKTLKNWGSGSTFLSFDVEKLHAAVAKRTFGSENVKKLSFYHFLKFWRRKIARRCGEKKLRSQNNKKLRVREHFLKFWCRKIARRCGETHIWKWTCLKTVLLGALFEVLMSKNCTPLWREARDGWPKSLFPKSAK